MSARYCDDCYAQGTITELHGWNGCSIEVAAKSIGGQHRPSQVTIAWKCNQHAIEYIAAVRAYKKSPPVGEQLSLENA